MTDIARVIQIVSSADFFIWLSGLGDDEIMKLFPTEAKFASDHHYVKKFNECQRNGAYFLKRLDTNTSFGIVAHYLKFEA